MNKEESLFRENGARWRWGFRVALACLGLLVLAGCGGDDYDSGNSYTGGGGGGGGTINISITPFLADIQDKVFTPICSFCHSGSVPAGGLDLSSVVNVFAIVGDTDSHGHKIIVPFDPDASYLIRKLEGSSKWTIQGLQMPQDGPPYLDQSTINVIRQWITDGAPEF